MQVEFVKVDRYYLHYTFDDSFTKYSIRIDRFTMTPDSCAYQILLGTRWSRWRSYPRPSMHSTWIRAFEEIFYHWHKNLMRVF